MSRLTIKSNCCALCAFNAKMMREKTTKWDNRKRSKSPLNEFHLERSEMNNSLAAGPRVSSLFHLHFCSTIWHCSMEKNKIVGALKPNAKSLRVYKYIKRMKRKNDRKRKQSFIRNNENRRRWRRNRQGKNGKEMF